MRPLPRRALLLTAAALPAPAARARTAASPAIAAASDLKFALDEIAARFAADSGRRARIVYGSSGNLTRQIRDGAPFEAFLSADEGYVFQLAEAGLTLGRGALYAEGRLALFAPHGSPVGADADFAGLRAALAQGRVRRFAIANPAHAPYGRAAEQALRAQGLWDSLEPFLVLGETVSQAAQFAVSGGAQGGIVAVSLTLAPELARAGTSAVLPTEWHAALRQRMVAMRGAGETAHAFLAAIAAPDGRAALARWGFAPPPSPAA